jgi:FMN-dependent oxidoreductase (nitrilotriacetate monooxygenase family)
MTALSAISMVTRHIGLVATASTTFCEPYNLARTLASVDLISGGRAGWNIVTTSDPDSGQNFGRPEVEHDLRYEIADEFVEVMLGLWDSIEADAVVADVESGQFVQREKVHFLDHMGKHFQVRGPLNAARCPQGYPVLIQAGASKAGQRFAAKRAEVMFTVQQDLEMAKEFYADMKRQVTECGRDPNHCKIMRAYCRSSAAPKKTHGPSSPSSGVTWTRRAPWRPCPSGLVMICLSIHSMAPSPNCPSKDGFKVGGAWFWPMRMKRT